MKVYPGGTRAVDGIDVTHERGEFVALLGPNGAARCLKP
jgi:ABC-2 type transport system ATP-binding protein